MCRLIHILFAKLSDLHKLKDILYIIHSFNPNLFYVLGEFVYCQTVACVFDFPGQVAMGNGGEVVMVEEKAEEATGSLDWSSATVETIEKKEVPEISGEIQVQCW